MNNPIMLPFDGRVFEKQFETASTTVTASTRKQAVSLKDYAAPSGYKAICFRFSGGSSSDVRNNIFLKNINLTSGDIYVENTGSSNVTGAIYVSIYYVKSNNLKTL